MCPHRILLAVIGSLFLGGCAVSVPKIEWKRITVGSLMLLDGKTISIDQEGKWFRMYGCSGHNPVIGICFSPGKHIVYVMSDGTELWRVEKPRNVWKLYPVDEKRLIGLERGEDLINVVEIRPDTAPRKLAEIPFKLYSSNTGKKLDINISRRGNMIGWGEPTGLSVINLNTGKQTKYLDGLPVRLPVFSEDEFRVAAHIWIGTSAANLPMYQGMTSLVAHEMKNHEYIQSENKTVFVGTTTEYAGLVVVDLQTGGLVKVSPTKWTAFPHDLCGQSIGLWLEKDEDYASCRSKFSDYEYTHSYSNAMREGPRSFYIDTFKSGVHFRKNNGELDPPVYNLRGSIEVNSIPQAERWWEHPKGKGK